MRNGQSQHAEYSKYIFLQRGSSRDLPKKWMTDVDQIVEVLYNKDYDSALQMTDQLLGLYGPRHCTYLLRRQAQRGLGRFEEAEESQKAGMTPNPHEYSKISNLIMHPFNFASFCQMSMVKISIGGRRPMYSNCESRSGVGQRVFFNERVYCCINILRDGLEL